MARGHFVWALKATPQFYDPQNLSFEKITKMSRKSNVYSKYRQKTVRPAEYLASEYLFTNTVDPNFRSCNFILTFL